MKKSRFTEEQMVAMLREADRTSVADVSKKYKVRDQTLSGCATIPPTREPFPSYEFRESPGRSRRTMGL
jgi:hypothetical protein